MQEKNFVIAAGRIFMLAIALVPVCEVAAQQDEFQRLLNEEVDAVNPVYKPVVGIGTGVLNYFGDIRNNNYQPTLGTPGFRIDLSSTIDNKRTVRADFFFMGGTVSGNQRSYSDPMENFNFRTSLYNFGVDLNYDFDHLFRNRERRLHPFISIGFSTLSFHSTTDSIGTYYDPETGSKVSARYHYWTDGTIRNLPQTAYNEEISLIMHRDFKYETSLRDIYDWGRGKYAEFAFAVPVDIGVELQLSDRTMLRLGNSFSYVLSDLIDHVSSKNVSGIIGKKGNDMFSYTYVSFHVDLFSSAKALKIEKLLATDFDPMLFGDEDFDGWMDGWDQCPGTPQGVVADSTGCPVDTDGDGIVDYLDREPLSRAGMYVNDQGVAITEDQLASLLDRSLAVGRNEIEQYIRRPEAVLSRQASGKVQIPDRFRALDTDRDNYISFDEMLREIDRYFDATSSLTATDIYELNSFFFTQ